MDMPFSQERPQDDHAVTGKLHLPRKLMADWDDDVYALGPTEGDCCVPVIVSGDRLLVSPSQVPTVGDFVVLWPLKGKPSVKRLSLGFFPKFAPGSEAQSCVAVEQTNPPRSFWINGDKLRAVHRVIAVISISEKPGWQDDGLYICDIPDWGGDFTDDIKVRTKRGAARKEPVGRMRYPQEWGKYVRRMKITDLAGEARS